MGVAFVRAASLLIAVGTEKTFYLPGEPVRMFIFKQNLSFFPVTLTYPTSQGYDFIVTGEGGEVWQWSEDKFFLSVVGHVTLLPGQSVYYTEVWPQINNQGRPVPSGIYQVTGWNTATVPGMLPRPSVYIRIVR